MIFQLSLRFFQICIGTFSPKVLLMLDKRYKFFNVVVLGPARASLMLYGEIGGKDGVDAEAVVGELMELQQSYPDIDVHINSQGGDVFAGISIFNALKDSTSRVNIYVDGLAASIAGVIALCGKPLHMSRFSRLMLHSVSAGCAGGAKQMRECADLIESLESTLASMISRKCGMSPEEVKSAFFDGVDHWFTAQEAYDRRLCDYIYDLDGGDSLGAAPTAEQVYAFVNRLQTPNNHNMDIINELKKDQSFANLTEEQILAKIRTATNQAAKVDALEAKVAALEAEKAEAKKQAVDAYLNQAVADGRIQSSQLEGFRKLMDADEASARSVIDALPKASAGKPSIKDFLNGAAGAGASKDLAQMSWDEIDQAERLAELKDKYPELYKAKFAEKFGA